MDKDKRFELEIYNALRELLIPAHLKGYEYLKAALRYVRQNPDSIYAMTSDLYPSVGDMYSVDGSNVEKAIRGAINKSKATDEGWYKVLGRTGPMSNSEFLATLSEAIRVRMALEGEE